MSRLALAGLSLFLLLMPLAVGKPGLPSALKADEAAYYLAALSLAHDFDLRFEQQDVDRLFDEFHFRHVSNVIVMSDDGWQTVYFGKPFLYSLVAAPFVGLLGANGMLFLNMLLTVAMMWMGMFYLARYNEESTAALFSAGFFLASTGFVYVFWLQPEVFNMFFVTVALFLGLGVAERFGQQRGPSAGLWRLAGSGAALAIASYSKPMILALALPIAVPLIAPFLPRHLFRGREPKRRTARSRRALPLLAWSSGVLFAFLGASGLAAALTGHPSSYLGEGVRREGVEICAPRVDPVAPLRAAYVDSNRTSALSTEASPGDSGVAEARNWSWLLRVPPFEPRQTLENLFYFWFGRHTGLALYFPFVVVALFLFLRHSRRLPNRWLLLLSLAIVALFFLLFIDWNWQGGGGFVGNRYFVNVVPGFLFLVTGVPPLFATLSGFAAAGLLIGPLLLTPFGATVPRPTLQAHTRNFPLRLFPLELTLRNVPGYFTVAWAGNRIIAREDQVVPRDRGFWVKGPGETAMQWLSLEPLERMSFRLEGFAPRTQLRVRLGDAHEDVALAAGEAKTIELRPLHPDRRRSKGRVRWNVYDFETETDAGAVVHWTEERPPRACRTFNVEDSSEEPFFAGAEITVLGPSDYLAANVFAAEWLEVDAPTSLVAGEERSIRIRLRNQSAYPWAPLGAARVRLSYHWLDDDGDTVVRDGLRTEIRGTVERGSEVDQTMTIRAPDRPGSYLLELDPVFERVAWFSDRGVATRRIPIEVSTR